MQLSTLHSVVRDVRAKLERMSFNWNGETLSRRDHRTYAEAIAYWVALLFDITPVSQQKHDIFYTNWAMRIAQCDVYDVACVSGEILSILRHGVKPWLNGKITTVFKRTFEAEGQVIAALLLSPVRATYESFVSQPNAEDLSILTQHLSFMSHVSLHDITVDTLSAYLEIEAHNNSFPYDQTTLHELNEIIRDWFSDFTLTLDNFFPEHGSGATSSFRRGTPTVMKYDRMGKDPALTYFCRHFFGVDCEYFVPESVALGDLRRCCTVQDVPKSIKTRRTISMEDTTLMYFQQGVRKALYEYIARHKYLRHIIFVEDASQNASAALRGSLTGDLSTIDLSSASDTVTHRLARALFRGTALDTISVCLRSRSASIPGYAEITLGKEAPMGSALCFPFECIIFAACMELGTRRARQKWGSFDTELYLGVHGDDMIVPDWAYWDVVRILESVGFFVNKSKSFTSPSLFRESCGMEAFNGVSVTPLKLSRKFTGSIPGTLYNGRNDGAPASFLALVQLANDCADKEYNILRSVVIADILKACPKVPPFFSEDPDKGIYSPMSDNYRAEQRSPNVGGPRSCDRYQRTEIRCVRIATQKTLAEQLAESDYEDRRLFETLRSSFLRNRPVFDPDDRIIVAPATQKLIVRYSWVSHPEGFYGAPNTIL